MQPLDGDFLPQAGHDDLAIVRVGGGLDCQQVAIQHACVAHAVATDAKQIVGVALEEAGVEREADLDVAFGQDGVPGCHAPHQGQRDAGAAAQQPGRCGALHGACAQSAHRHAAPAPGERGAIGPPGRGMAGRAGCGRGKGAFQGVFGRRQQADAARGAGTEFDHALAGQRLQVIFSGIDRPEAQRTGDFRPGGGKAGLVEMRLDLGKDFPLPGGEGAHGGRRIEEGTRAISLYFCPVSCEPQVMGRFTLQQAKKVTLSYCGTATQDASAFCLIYALHSTVTGQLA